MSEPLHFLALGVLKKKKIIKSILQNETTKVTRGSYRRRDYRRSKHNRAINAVRLQYITWRFLRCSRYRINLVQSVKP